MKNIKFMVSEARAKLSRLGMSLFYLYISLVLAGCAGIVFGIVTLVLECTPLRSTLNTPLWAAISLPVVCWFMVKIFLRESLNLVGMGKAEVLRKFDEVVEQTVVKSNVVPFKRG